MTPPLLPEDHDETIRRIREGLDLPGPIEPYDGPEQPPVVQLSVRLSPRLRHDLAQVARRRGQTVTDVVIEALEDAVHQATDPLAALTARMVAEFRTDLGRAVESGAYAEAAAAVDRLDGGSGG